MTHDGIIVTVDKNNQCKQFSIATKLEDYFTTPVINETTAGKLRLCLRLGKRNVCTHFSDSAPYVNTFVLVEGSQVLHSLPIELPDDLKHYAE